VPGLLDETGEQWRLHDVPGVWLQLLLDVVQYPHGELRLLPVAGLSPLWGRHRGGLHNDNLWVMETSFGGWWFHVGESRDDPPEQFASPFVPCMNCSAPLMSLHCKLVCTNCGFVEDCTDLWDE